MRRLLLLASLVLALDAQALELDWVTVAPGNVCDVQSQGCFGAVANAYQIARYETTNAQYTEFLNAVAAVDPNRLHTTLMGQDDVVGGIHRRGLPGSFSYETEPGFENKPVMYTSYYDAVRFANWLHNGQPTGPQGPATTEDGAYTLTGINNGGPRNPEAEVFVPSEDEWYRAAYYDAASMTYFDYPAGTDAVMTCEFPVDDTGNSANCEWFDDEGGGPTPVGAFALSESPSGTFDQGGNAAEWNEATLSWGTKGLRGGDWHGPHSSLAASHRGLGSDGTESRLVGFRVARLVPECANGFDDDGDGLTDLDDFGCGDAADLDEHDPTLPCDDGEDNDGDELFDFPADPVCQSVSYGREDAICQDGVSNDADGLVDFDGGASHNGGVPLTAPDPQCVGKPWQNKETPNSCGLGAELGLLLPFIGVVATRRRRASRSSLAPV